jgi:hypothetical protein
MKAVAILSQLIGVAVLVVGAKRRDYLLMVGGMLWAAGNMYYYAMLYLLPVLVIELFSRKDRKDLNHEIHGIHEKGRPHRDPLSSVLRRLSFLLPMTNFSRVERVDDKKGLLIWIELGLWLALLSPLQVVVLGHSANQVIGNVALMGLMGIRLVCGGNCLAAKNAKSAKIFNHEIHETHEKGVWSGYGGRLIYLKGYRDGTDEERVELLKNSQLPTPNSQLHFQMAI